MASGASPSSNQRSSLPDDPLSADGIVATGRKSRNPAIRRTHSTKIEFSESASPPSLGLVNCVVCGDRACSHYYYGVAACHGCKCFFWRSVKQQAQYICRYDKNCNITVNARNACRFCRFQRCINAGMQPESVRMSKDEKQIKTKKHSISAQNSPEMSSSFDMEQPSPKKPNNAGTMLLGKFFDIEAKAQEEADFNENSGTGGINNLQEIFDFPECMSAYRTKIMYCVRLHSVTQEEMNFCKFRTLTYASDYIRALSLFDDGFISTNDQISLLRSCYGPLTVFNIVYGTVNATRETSLLCFPTGITVSKNEEMKTNSFVNHFLVANIIDTLIPNVRELCLTECEYMLIKAIIVLNDEGLSTEGKAFVSSLRDKVHATLYEQCQRDKSDSDAPLRFAKLLHLLPKISKNVNMSLIQLQQLNDLLFLNFARTKQSREHMIPVDSLKQPTQSLNIMQEVGCQGNLINILMLNYKKFHRMFIEIKMGTALAIAVPMRGCHQVYQFRIRYLKRIKKRGIVFLLKTLFIQHRTFGVVRMLHKAAL